jgi:hypothetical protein
LETVEHDGSGGNVNTRKTGAFSLTRFEAASSESLLDKDNVPALPRFDCSANELP